MGNDQLFGLDSKACTALVFKNDEKEGNNTNKSSRVCSKKC